MATVKSMTIRVTGTKTDVETYKDTEGEVWIKQDSDSILITEEMARELIAAIEEVL